MERKVLNKYLLGVGILAALNVPLYFYSQHLLRAKLAAAETQVSAESEAHGEDPAAAHGDEAHGHPAAAQAAHASSAHGADSASESAAQAEEADYKRPLWTGYKPPLLNKCKALHRKHLKEEIDEKSFKAFAYSYDGVSASCAAAVSPKSQKQADQAAINECEENKESTAKAAVCRIYILDESSKP
jgi:hypothetical protein